MLTQKPILSLYTDPGLIEPRTRIKRFWKHVKATGDGCHPWTGAKMNLGYGVLVISAGRFSPQIRLYAHRVAWVLSNQQDIPDGYVIDHTCGNKACCNPEHLQCVTQTANVDRYHTQKPNAGFCAAGHKRPIGEVCAICRAAKVAAWMKANPEARREHSRKYEAKRSLERKAATAAKRADQP